MIYSFSFSALMPLRRPSGSANNILRLRYAVPMRVTALLTFISCARLRADVVSRRNTDGAVSTAFKQLSG